MSVIWDLKELRREINSREYDKRVDGVYVAFASGVGDLNQSMFMGIDNVLLHT